MLNRIYSMCGTSNEMDRSNHGLGRKIATSFVAINYSSWIVDKRHRFMLLGRQFARMTSGAYPFWTVDTRLWSCSRGASSGPILEMGDALNIGLPATLCSIFPP